MGLHESKTQSAGEEAPCRLTPPLGTAASPPRPQVALSLRLVMAKALRRMGKLDEAETHFKVLAGEAGCCRGGWLRR